jgi:pimeloyl-ACP methyl ester carboxylesterase
MTRTNSILRAGIGASFVLLSFLNQVFASARTQVPASLAGTSSFKQDTVQCGDHSVVVFLPLDDSAMPRESAPVVVFGHGWLLSLQHYQSTLQELAKAGIVVIFPSFGSNWLRADHFEMAHQYLSQTICVLVRYRKSVDFQRITFAGHSLGAKVAALAAAGASEAGREFPQNLLLLETALGGDEENFAREFAKLSPKVAVLVVHAKGDSIARQSESQLVYDTAPGLKKELLNLESTNVGHDWPMTNYFLMGLWGGLVGPLHTMYLWPWLKTMANNDLPSIDKDQQVPGVPVDVIRPHGSL